MCSTEVKLTHKRTRIVADSPAQLIGEVACHFQTEKKMLRDRCCFLIAAIPFLSFTLGREIFPLLCIFWAAAEVFLLIQGRTKGAIGCLLDRYRDCRCWKIELARLKAVDSNL